MRVGPSAISALVTDLAVASGILASSLVETKRSSVWTFESLSVERNGKCDSWGWKSAVPSFVSAVDDVAKEGSVLRASIMAKYCSRFVRISSSSFLNRSRTCLFSAGGNEAILSGAHHG
eukprot:CAMPEP_0184694146 /NCGR_PEP_ID=MMETSP0313-20130426/2194_1 /TAXON_ID=2792 /ORGANISM="Porphyridium aerugineum, Strain SAG 1380-2" /LENGTH=118 /DNA_ID=CAMNT_0027152383 /DNA_START=19 /DNA_END=371 /DNA_ORIENTATION=+